MIALLNWIKNHCFRHLEREKHRNHLLLFVVGLTYALAEANVLINHEPLSREHLIFFGASASIFSLGLVLNRIERLEGAFKYIMMTLLLLHAMNQAVLFRELPAVYQVFYFNLALTLIYLNGRLTLYVGAISLLFTAVAGAAFHRTGFHYLEPSTINIPIGILAETTLVLWASSKIGTSYAIIVETKDRLARLLRENETQLRIIERQNKVLETYARQVETLAKREERGRIGASLRQELKQLARAAREKQGEPGQESLENAAVRIWKDIDDVVERLAGVEEGFVSQDGLEAELRERAVGFQETTGMEVAVRAEGEPYALPRSHNVTLLRALQDFMIGAAMDRQASDVEAALEYRSGVVRLTLTDNGGKPGEGRMEAAEPLHKKCTELNGTFDIKSFRGKGSVWDITLPVPQERANRIAVLLVDPDPFVRESVALILGEEDDIVIAGALDGGPEAVDYCRRERPDVVLMEVNLPGMDGIEVMRSIKTANPGIQIILFTHRHEVGIVAEAVEAGADAYLLKSMNPRNLAASVRHLMDGGTLLSRQTTAMLASQVLRGAQLERLERKYVSQAVMKEYGLKEKELQILELLAKGKKYREIASSLFLSEGTVRNYLSGIYAKLNAEDRDQAVEKAVRLGLVPHQEQAG